MLAAGTYTIIARDVNGCTTSTSVTLNTEPLDGTITQANGTLTSSQDDVEYQWRNCDNNTNIIGATNQSFTPSENGDYRLFIINEFGCALTTPCISFITSGIDNQLNTKIKVFPNPITDYLFIYFEEEFNDTKIVIKDITGKTILERSEFNSKENSISVDSFNQGIYFVEIIKHQKRSIYKIIKK